MIGWGREMAERVAGWLLHPEDRYGLMAVFPPAYPKVVAHHVTLRAGVPQGFPLPPETEGFIVAWPTTAWACKRLSSRSAGLRVARTAPPTTYRGRLGRAAGQQSAAT